MVLGAMLKFMKYLLFAVNFLFVLAGLLLVAFGSLVLARFQIDFLRLFMTSNFNAAAIALIVAGVLIMFIAFLGCCGAIKENYCMIVTFGVLLTIVLVLQIAVAVTGIVMKAKVEDLTGKAMLNSIKQYDRNATVTSFNNAWNDMQMNLDCCGAQNFTDWSLNDGFKSNNDVPDSCCVNFSPNCGKGQRTNPTLIATKSCTRTLIGMLQQNLAIVIGVAAAIAVIELLGIIFAFGLARGIRSGYDKMDA